MSKPFDTIVMHVLQWGVLDVDIRIWFLNNMLVSTNHNTVYIHIPFTWSIRARKIMMDRIGKQCRVNSSILLTQSVKANELCGFKNVHKVEEPEKDLIDKWDINYQKEMKDYRSQ